jgi:hypothetical protein
MMYIHVCFVSAFFQYVLNVLFVTFYILYVLLMCWLLFVILQLYVDNGNYFCLRISDEKLTG